MAEEVSNFFEDEVFQDLLVLRLVKDISTLKACAHLLDPEDFKPLRGMKNGRARWMLAERALAYYNKYKEPAGTLIRADFLDYAKQLNLGNGQVVEVTAYLDQIGKLKAQ